MTVIGNPIDDVRIDVLRNQSGDLSFWPSYATVPAGWEVVLHDACSADAEEFVRRTWTTLTPWHRAGSVAPGGR